MSMSKVNSSNLDISGSPMLHKSRKGMEPGQSHVGAEFGGNNGSERHGLLPFAQKPNKVCDIQPDTSASAISYVAIFFCRVFWHLFSIVWTVSPEDASLCRQKAFLNA
jgi:hypothetical protein